LSFSRKKQTTVLFVSMLVLSCWHPPGKRYLFSANRLDICILSSSSNAAKDLVTTVFPRPLSSLRDLQPVAAIPAIPD